MFKSEELIWNEIHVNVMNVYMTYRRDGDFGMDMVFHILPVGLIRRIPLYYPNSHLQATIEILNPK